MSNQLLKSSCVMSHNTRRLQQWWISRINKCRSMSEHLQPITKNNAVCCQSCEYCVVTEKKRQRGFCYLINNKSLFQYLKYENETEKMNAASEETLYSQLLVQHATERSCELLAKTETIPGNDTSTEASMINKGHQRAYTIHRQLDWPPRTSAFKVWLLIFLSLNFDWIYGLLRELWTSVILISMQSGHLI